MTDTTPPCPRRFGRFAAGLAIMPLLAGCSHAHLSFLAPQGPIAAAQRDHFWLVIAITLVVVLPVFVLTPVIVWRYRYGGRATYRPRWSFSRRLEYVIWGIPFLIVGILAVFLWRQTYALDPYNPLPADTEPLHVQVVGYDWKWLFIYPDQHIATVDELVFPDDRPLALELTSDTVMQSFFIPSLGSQVYAMNGMVTRLHLAADGPGRFRGENSQYNGKGFHTQRFTARAVSDAAFSDFVARVRRQGRALDRPTYQILDGRNTVPELARALDGTGDDALRFSAIPDGLFSAIVAGVPIQSLLPGPVVTSARQTPLHQPQGGTP